ncbi:UNVERIFIED_CONTAM: hypothetical protein Scaly_1116300 [Sesamum calycinum]|uniref:Retrotransposon gag protein n=1 Tax=Sesamum calycinum TaxID=2727403 RepID=A0AAW2QMD5_9LAMI
MAANNQQFGSKSDNPPRKVHEVSTSVDERLDKLTFLVEKILVGGTQQVKACGICTSSGHFTDACPTLQEEPTMHANAVGGFSGPSQRGHDPFSNTYNPGWRDHPNLRYGNQPQNSQRPPYQQPPPPQTNSNSGTSLEDMIKILVANTQQFQQETRASIQNFGVSSEPISLLRQSFGVPSEKELQFENSTRRGQAQQGKTEDSIERGHVEQGKTGEELKILPKQAEKSNPTHEEHPKVFVPKPPFPERFAKSKKKEEEREILETLRKVEVNIPLLDVIKQVPRYAKFLKELCTNKSKLRGNERVSMGESVSAILQRKLPPKCKDPETGVVIQLVDRSIVYPKGVLEDILVQVNELIFPADFYVLDMTENTSPNFTSILLGRPFLKTSKTKIDVDAGILSMEFDNEVVSFNIGGVTQNSSDIHSVFLIDFIDPLVQENAMFDGGEHSR